MTNPEDNEKRSIIRRRFKVGDLGQLSVEDAMRHFLSDKPAEEAQQQPPIEEAQGDHGQV